MFAHVLGPRMGPRFGCTEWENVVWDVQGPRTKNYLGGRGILGTFGGIIGADPCQDREARRPSVAALGSDDLSLEIESGRERH